MLLPGLLNLLSPEVAHRAAIQGARMLKFLPTPTFDPCLHVHAFGLSFPNPVGLAAGFDKSAEAFAGLAQLGFGFVEVGTVTPWPQRGNPKPRLFRLKEDRAVINRMGFNNDGYARVKHRLTHATRRGVVGVNFGPNKDSVDRVADYILGMKTFVDVADYFTMNISSPNTPGLRDLHTHGELERLLASTLAARDLLSPRRPVLLKIAPDLDDDALDVVLAVAISYRIDGLIVSNTTVTRSSDLSSRNANETGGLSGRPLFLPSTKMVARCFIKSANRIPIIAVGGIDSFTTALEKFEAGAQLLQIYTGMIYRGPSIISEINNGLVNYLRSKNLKAVSDLIGVRAVQIGETV